MDKWRKLNEIFHGALQTRAVGREDFLRSACEGDEDLYRDVKSLLDSAERDGNFLDQSAFAIGGEAFSKLKPDTFIGRQIGAHQLISKISEGGMGMVYLAQRTDDVYQQRVAVKIIRHGMDSPPLVERFRRERQFLAHLNHPNIARLLDGGTTDEDLPYLVMEYVDGVPVTDYVIRERLSVTARLKLFQKICSAVDYAHNQGIIHRDIKPSNILVGDDGEPKLLDFGIAKVWSETPGDTRTVAEWRIFTPDYASPEQIRGQDLSPLTDVYSLGVLLYEILTAQKPFEFENRSPLEIARIICEKEPQNPSTAIFRHRRTVAGTDESSSEFLADETRIFETSRMLRGDLDNIILMALRKESSRRYKTAGDFSADIEKYIKNLPVQARPSGLLYRSSKLVRRNRATAFVSFLLIASIAIFGAFIVFPKKTRVVYASPPAPNDDAVKLTNLPSTDNFLKISFDNKAVFFVSNKQLYDVNVDSRAVNRMNFDSSILRVVQSHDGKLLAVGKPDGIYITDKNLGNQKKVSDCGSGRFAWSPDNRQVVFSCEKERRLNVFVAGADGAPMRRVTDFDFASDPDWSPDGKTIIFAAENEKSLDVYSIGIDGTNLVDLTKNSTSSDRLPVFSPDGRQIVFVSDRSGHEELYVMYADGSDVWKLTNSKSYAVEPAWSPDGKLIAFISNRDGNDGIYLINVEELILAEKTSNDIDASFSPDGRHIAFASNRHGSYQIYVSDVDGKNISQLTSGKNDSGFPRWSPDGRQIAFDSNRDGVDAVYLMNGDGTNQVRLTSTELPCRRPSWSMDGKKLAFSKYVDENNEIFTFDLDSGTETRLTENRKNDDFAVWTKEGRIVFFSDRDSPRNDVYMMNSDGSRVVNLTNHPANDGQPTVSRDGTIVFNSNRSHAMELWFMGPDGSNQTQLTNSGPDDFMSRPQFAPDGKTVVYDSNENDREVLRFITLP